MPTVTLSDGAIHYEVHGQGPPVLLISGLGGQASAWRCQIAPFAERFTTIVHDHRGTGQSARTLTDYSIEKLAADVIAILDALEIPRAHVVGHSTGGAIAQTLALDYPDRIDRVVLAATFARCGAVLASALAFRRDVLRAMGPEAYLKLTPYFIYPSWWLEANPDVLATYAARGSSQFPGVEIMARKIEALLAYDRTRDLARLRQPALVVCADNDALVPQAQAEELVRLIPGARLAVIPQGGHTCKQTTADAFNRLVIDFLAA